MTSFSIQKLSKYYIGLVNAIQSLPIIGGIVERQEKKKPIKDKRMVEKNSSTKFLSNKNRKCDKIAKRQEKKKKKTFCTKKMFESCGIAKR